MCAWFDLAICGASLLRQKVASFRQAREAVAQAKIDKKEKTAEDTAWRIYSLAKRRRHVNDWFNIDVENIRLPTGMEPFDVGEALHRLTTQDGLGYGLTSAVRGDKPGTGTFKFKRLH